MMTQPLRRDCEVENAPEARPAPTPPAAGWVVARRAPPTLQAHIIETMNERLASAIELAAAVKLAHRQLSGGRGTATEPLVRELHAVLDGYVDALSVRITKLGGVRAPVRAALRAPGHATLSVRATDGPPRPLTLLRALGELVELPGDERRVHDALGANDRADVCAAVARAVYQWLWCLEVTTEALVPVTTARARAVRRD